MVEGYNRGEFDHGWPYWKKERMALQPLGHRVLIKPDEQPEQSGLIVLPQDRDHVSYSGTVVAVGNGSLIAENVRASVVKRCKSVVKDIQVDYPDSTALREVLEALTVYEHHSYWRKFGVKVGDRVAFSAESGLTFTEDGVEYLVMNEDDVVVLVKDEESAA